MAKYILTALLLALFSLPAISQSYAFGVKGGLTVGFQKWDNTFQRDPLYRYHGIAFIESADEEEKFSLFAQAGYHVKGSAIRTFRTSYQTQNGNIVDIPAREIPFEFHNISLVLGAKQKFNAGDVSKYYYLIGIRGDYTVDTKLGPEIDENDPYYLFGIYPVEEFVRKFNYGFTIGGGYELGISEFVSTLVELTVNPDFSRQYLQPRIENVPNPNSVISGGNSRIDIAERQIINTTIELTLGFRFLHKIEYIDDY